MSRRAALQRITRSEDETVALAERLGRLALPGDTIALHGELGAGKTRFVRGVARGLGVSDRRIASPTYVLMTEHEGLRARLVHIDAYRVRSAAELDESGLDQASAGDAVVVVEWAERVEDALPPDRLDVTIARPPGAGEDERSIALRAEGRWADRLASLGEDVEIAEDPAAPAGPTRCRTCGAALGTIPAAPLFCSERCRLADLAKWFRGEYKVSRELKDSDLDQLE